MWGKQTLFWIHSYYFVECHFPWFQCLFCDLQKSPREHKFTQLALHPPPHSSLCAFRTPFVLESASSAESGDRESALRAPFLGGDGQSLLCGLFSIMATNRSWALCLSDIVVLLGSGTHSLVLRQISACCRGPAAATT